MRLRLRPIRSIHAGGLRLVAYLTLPISSAGALAAFAGSPTHKDSILMYLGVSYREIGNGTGVSLLTSQPIGRAERK